MGIPDAILEKKEIRKRPKICVFKNYDEAQAVLVEKLNNCHKSDLIRFCLEMLCYQLSKDDQVYEPMLGIDIEKYTEDE